MAKRPTLDSKRLMQSGMPAVATLAMSLMLGACSQLGPDNNLLSGLGDNATAETAAAKPDPKSELQKATEYWGAEYAKNPRNPDTAVNYARNLKAMGHKDQAVAVLQQASIYGSEHKGLASEYGRLALEADQVGLAEKLLSRAEDPMKPDWKLVSAQGATLAKQGRHKDAIGYFERALVLSPNNASVMNNLAMAHAMNGEAPKAEDILRRAAEQPNANPRVRQNLALVLGLQGKFDEAKQVAGTDMSPEKAQASVAYLQRMVDAKPVQALTSVAGLAPKAEPKRLAAADTTSKARKSPPAELKGSSGPADAQAVASSGWTTEVARADQPIMLMPKSRQ